MNDKSVLTDTEWLDALWVEGEVLPMCCTPISNFRDALFGLVRNGRDLNSGFASLLYEEWLEVLKAHDAEELPVMARLMEAIKVNLNK